MHQLRLWLLRLILAAFFAPVLADYSVIVSTSFGKLGGFTTLTKSADPSKSTANVFLGVPYAIPPKYAIRFDKTVGCDIWRDVRDATKFGASCTPLVKQFMYHKDRVYDEDCLFLNVITPTWKNVVERQGFPVMVFFHGGGFGVGDAHDFGYEFFAEHYVTRGVIVVTVQYRLGMLGFLAFDEEKEMSGNYGLWDARKALQYVQQEITHFGGNPSHVTIFGHSAGAAIVGHLVISPQARNLFANAIQMSGSPFAEWACSERIEAGHAIVYEVKCNRAFEGRRNICMGERDINVLLDALEKIGYKRPYSLNPFIFTPHFDGDFLQGDLIKSIREVKEIIPIMIGIADSEGILLTLGKSFRALSDLYVAPEDYDSFDEAHFISAIDRLLTNDKSTGSDAAAADLRYRLVDFYIRRADQHPTPTAFGGFNKKHFYLRQYTKLVSDVMFLVPALIDAQEKAKAGWPVFLYRFNYVNKDTIDDSQKSIYTANTHGGEHPYLFGLRYDTKSVPFNEDDLKFQKNYLDAITQFAIKRNPSTSMAWPVLKDSAIDKLSHMELGPNLIVHDSIPFFTATLAFWLKVRADFPTIPEIRAFPVRQRNAKVLQSYEF